MAERQDPIWVRLLRVYREKGLGGVWFGALSRLGYRRLVLLERHLDEPVQPVLARVEAEIRPLRSDDEAAFVALGQEDAGVFRSRLEAGHRGWGAWCAGGLRYVSWVGFRETEVEYLGCRLVLADDVAYVYRAFTEPQHRRLGLGPATQAACMEVLRRRGFRLVLAAVVPDNPWAFPPWFRVGYRRIAVVRTVGTGRRRRVFVRLDKGSGAPVGWRFERSRRGGPLAVDGPA